MPEVDVTHITYKDVTSLELVPSKGFMGLTDMILLIQNDTTRRATLSTLLERLKDTVTVVNGKSAYELAVDNGFEGTEKEWLESFGSSDELKAVLGDYVVVDAGWAGNSLVPVDSSATIPENAYIIYRVKQKDGVSYLYYTINPQGTGYDEWFGMIPVVDEMEKVVKSYIPETIYTNVDANTKYAKITDNGSGVLISSEYVMPTTGDFGHIYNVRDYSNSEDLGKWYFNTYGTLHEYEGVAQYVQTLMSETLPTAKKAVTADKLTTKREIILNNSDGDVIGKTTFDGSANAIINFTPGMINAALLAQTDGKVPISISGTATKLAIARTISLSGLVTGSASFDGSADVKIATKVDTDSIVAGSAKKLNKSVPLKVTGGGSNEGITKTVDGATVYFSNVGTKDGSFIPSSKQVYTWYPSYGTIVNKYDGTTPVDLVLTRVDASILYGDTPAAISITGSAASAGSFDVGQRANSTDMVLVGVANSDNMSNGKNVLYDQRVYVANMDKSGNKNSVTGNSTVVSPQFKGTLIGNSSTATKAASMTSYTKSITSTAVAFAICDKKFTQTVSNAKNFEVTIPMNWAANVFINPGDSLLKCANYVLSVNTEITCSFDGTNYTVSMGSISSSSTVNWSSAFNGFYDKYNSTYSKTANMLCANKISGESFRFGMLMAFSGPDSKNMITLTTRVLADCYWASSFTSRTVTVSLSSFGALPMPDAIDLDEYSTHFPGSVVLIFYAAEPVSLPLRAKPNTDYGTYRFRNIAFGTGTNPTSESGYDATWGGNGAIYIRY